MDTETLRRALTESGMTGYEVEAYLTVLEVGSGPVVQVAEQSSVPAAQIYETVRSLEDRGFVETIERDRLHVRAREPTEVLEALRSKSQLLADAADEVETRWERPSPEAYRVNVHKRRATVVENARTAIEDAEVAVEVAATPSQLETLQPALREASDRGVLTRATLFGDRDAIDPSRLGVNHVRWRELPGPFVAIVDRRQAYFSPSDHHGEAYGVVIDDDILTLVLHWYYLTQLWVPCENVFVDPETSGTYTSLEAFVRDVAPLWHDGVQVRLRVYGRRPDDGDSVEVAGTLTDVSSGLGETVSRRPTMTDLSGYATLTVDASDRSSTVGGWGAILEDVEAAVIVLEGLTFPEP